ncbi:hypothetical protein [Streptomyces sp. NPDC058612]|uniref:hypothetical protein n=1 Tax=Streptomyces sp. NPDC058612 TaxID=3346555 RepID=UPI003648B941
MAHKPAKRMPMRKRLLDLREARVMPLRQLRPPGALYRSWFFLPAGMNPDVPESWGLFGLDGAARPAGVLKLHELAPFYGGEIPEAALSVDEYISALNIPVRRRDGRAAPTPMKNFVASVESRTATKTELAPSRDSVHRLHARGMFVLGDDLAARISVTRPRTPSDAWTFRDGQQAGSRQVHRPGHEGTPPNAGRLGKLGIPSDLPADLRDLLVSLGQEYREALGKSEDPETVIERNIRKAAALARWAAEPSATEKVKASALTAEALAETGRRRLHKIHSKPAPALGKPPRTGLPRVPSGLPIP